MTQYLLDGFEHCVQLPLESLDKSYEIQEWCEEQIGSADSAGWALGYGVIADYQNWYFREGRDALMFRLRWA